MTNTAVHISAFDKIHDGGVSITTLPVPVPGDKQVLVRVTLRPVNPADIFSLKGVYPGFQPKSLPAVPGLEGVGVVESVGAGVTKLKVGQRVVPFLLDSPRSWQNYVVVSEDDAWVVPDNVNDEGASQLVVNPFTAWAMIFDVLNLQPGQFLLQSAAGSTLGRQVIALAKRAGIKTINIVRRPAQIDELKAIGADHVLLQSDSNLVENIRKLTPGSKGVDGAIDAVAGDLTKILISGLAPGKTLLVYGAMAGFAFEAGVGDVLFRNCKVGGYWLALWYPAASQATKERMIKELWEAYSLPGFADHVGTKYPLEKVLEAVTESIKDARGGKVFLQ